MADLIHRDIHNLKADGECSISAALAYIGMNEYVWGISVSSMVATIVRAAEREIND